MFVGFKLLRRLGRSLALPSGVRGLRGALSRQKTVGCSQAIRGAGHFHQPKLCDFLPLQRGFERAIFRAEATKI
jgi:hypothetical protein